MPKHERAASAVMGGADAVFELPFPWCAASAEYFARAGVYALSAIGVDTIAFGSESADADALFSAARRASELSCRSIAQGGVGSATEYFSALKESLSGPNDILAVEYLKAAYKMKLPLSFEVIRRVGAGYNEKERGEGYPSATAVRHAVFSGQPPFGLPDEALEMAMSNGSAPVSIKNIESAVLAFWRNCAPSDLAECGAGVAQRLHSCACKAAGIEEFFELAATKKYTNARLRRAVLFGMTGVTYADLDSSPAYISLLAANENGRSIAAIAKKRGDIPIVTKPSRIPDTANARRQYELTVRLESLYTLAMPQKRESSFFLTRSPIIKEICKN
jgi:predicted nucleotidyltransferase